MTRFRREARTEWASKTAAEKKEALSRRVENYHEQVERLCVMPMIAERGINLNGFGQVDSRVPNIIEQFGWERLVQQPPAHCSQLVMEFYGSIDPVAFEQTHTVYFRGTKIKFAPRLINDYYGLHTHPCNQFLDGLPDLEVFKKKLHPAIALDLRENGDYVWDTARLLYCIKNGHMVCIGDLIKAQMEEAAWRANTTPRSMPFPALITAFCRTAGVIGPEDDLTNESLAAFSKTNWPRQYTLWSIECGRVLEEYLGETRQTVPYEEPEQQTYHLPISMDAGPSGIHLEDEHMHDVPLRSPSPPPYPDCTTERERERERDSSLHMDARFTYHMRKMSRAQARQHAKMQREMAEQFATHMQAIDGKLDEQLRLMNEGMTTLKKGLEALRHVGFKYHRGEKGQGSGSDGTGEP